MHKIFLKYNKNLVALLKYLDTLVLPMHVENKVFQQDRI